MSCDCEEVIEDRDAAVVSLQIAEETIKCLRIELQGEQKAKAILLAGLESVVEKYDAQKHELRRLQAEIDRMRLANG